MPALTISAVNAGSDQLTITAHGQVTGAGPSAVFVGSGGVIPGGLAPVTDYWLVVVDANTVKLADSSAHALANVTIDITSTGTLPLQLLIGLPYRRPMTAVAGAQIKSANDNSTWDSLVALWNFLTGQAQAIFAGLVLAINTSITLSGTGYIRRGNDTRTIPVFAGSGWNFTSGALPGYTTPGSQSPVHLVPGTYYYPIPLDSQRERAQVVTVYADAVTVDCTLALVTNAAAIGAAWAAIAGATGTIVAGGLTRTVALTPTTPAVLAAGTTLWLKVVVPATATADVIAMDLTTDVP